MHFSKYFTTILHEYAGELMKKYFSIIIICLISCNIYQGNDEINTNIVLSSYESQLNQLDSDLNKITSKNIINEYVNVSKQYIELVMELVEKLKKHNILDTFDENRIKWENDETQKIYHKIVFLNNKWEQKFNQLCRKIEKSYKKYQYSFSNNFYNKLPIVNDINYATETNSSFIIGGDIVILKDSYHHKKIIDAINMDKYGISNNYQKGFHMIGTPIWANNELVYTFEESVSLSNKISIHTAMQTWTSTGAVKFKELPHDGWNQFCWVIGIPIVTINQKNIGVPGAYSTFGATSHAHLTIQENFTANQRVALHELGHSLGLAHEHQRFDRDHYITIQKANIYPGFENQFEIIPRYVLWMINAEVLSNYDYNSIMHYTAYLFSVNGLPVITRNDGSQSIGGYQLTSTDINSINTLY